jgi:archaeal cell division control protein 6
MGLFDEMLKEGESLFLDTIALDVDFVPGVIKHRENEQHYIAECLKPLFHKRSGKNLFITGGPGIGKTVAVRHVLQELHKETDQIATLYVNCWKKDTAHKIALELCDQLEYKFVHNKDTTDLFRDIAKILNKKAAVIVLDEADKIVGDELFYTLMEDIYLKSLILITNERDWLAKIDNRVRSRLMVDVLEFTPYTYEEIKDILQERVGYAFVPGVFQPDALELVTEKTHQAGDIRTGLFLLKQAGEVAEGKGLRTITREHVEKSVEKVKDFHIKSPDQLGGQEQRILNFVNDHSGKTAKIIHELYSQEEKMSYSTFQRRLKQLEKGKFISLKEVNTGQLGKTTLVMKGNTKLYDF